MQPRCLDGRRRWRTQTTAWLLSACCAGSAGANINVQFRPVHQVVNVGQQTGIGVFVVSDSAQVQLMSAAQIIVGWNPTFLRLLGNSQTGATPLLSSGFPVPDPHGLNEASPPQDGNGLYVASANFLNPVPATPAGTLLTTLLFEPL